MKNNIIKRGRPKLDRELVQTRLGQLGWTIPEAVKYKGADEAHTLVCIHCGHITERRLHNVVYRGETCPHTSQHENIQNNNTGAPAAIDVELLTKVVAETVEKSVESIKELILGTAINREDLITKFTKTYAGAVSRKGYIKYNRHMTTEEWFEESTDVARQLITRLDPANTSNLLSNFEYHRKKNPQNKPEKIMLTIMSKTMLYRALEQIQLIKVML